MRPVSVSGIVDAAQIAAGGSHTCVLHRGGTASCWGRNVRGQLGDGSTASHSVPTVVPGVSAAAQLSASRDMVCTRVGESAVLAECAPGAPGGCTSARVERCDPSGEDHTCARREDGTVLCWGRNDRGQLGDGSTTDRHTPTPVPALTGVREAAAGGRHTCARAADSSILCWGDDAWGESSLNIDTAVTVTAPLPVGNLP